jgi:Flp pilus assembly protein TadG
MRWVIRRAGTQDRGAIALLVALVTTGVLLGAGAVVLNTGTWYAERAQLQNGADAAAWKMAAQCASSTKCPVKLDATGRTQIAQDEANSNANDKAAKIDYICGTSDTGDPNPLNVCDPTTQANGHSCPVAPVLADGTHPSYVNVHTSTKTSSGDTSIPFIGPFVGAQNVKNCAQVAWGPLGSGSATPFTVSYCEWYKATSNGSAFAKPPPYPSPTVPFLPPAYPNNKYLQTILPVPGGEGVLALHGTASTLNSGDFDTDTTGSWNKVPNGGSGPTLVQPYTANSSYIHDGDGSLQITWKAGAIDAEGAEDANEATTAGSVYILTAWVKADAAAGSPSVSLYVKNPRTGPGAATFYSPATSLADGAWHQLTYQFTAAGNAVDVGVTNATAATLNQITYVDTAIMRLATNPECAGVPAPNGGGSGFDQSGGFGWLQHPSGTCAANVSVNNVAWDNTGAAVDGDCKDTLEKATCAYAVTVANPCAKQPLFVPLYNGLCSTSSSGCNINVACASAGPRPPGANGCYQIVGFAEFVPTGFQVSGSGGLKQNSWISNTRYCKGQNQCIYGFFTHDIVHSISDLGGLSGGSGGVPGAPVLVFSG